MIHAENFMTSDPFPKEARTKWENTDIIKAIHRSQHAQRNFDRTKKIPTDDLKTIITAATQCPSKQNVAFYDLYVIENKKVIDSVYETTTNLMLNGKDNSGYETLSNPQVLGNLLLIFVEKDVGEGSHKEANELNAGINIEETKRITNLDRHVAVGLAAGYVNMTATLLGYETGCCSCVMEYDKLKEILGTDKHPILLMGVGFKNDSTNRRMHPLKDTPTANEQNWLKKFPTNKKQSIMIKYVKGAIDGS